ncbi:nuclear transport factor 2 family protein [Altererythrobacter arenosus]|uniref:Nuclear transport factor 2 family protein n=1 Tax=Altererythrobacter arenosus TaxID=3032592 RepID=A0ABY8FMI7_9SPHN|nr:nuclear transport factor 2 family protein [Altererythrobacter sp. CAU 1644]WFL76244.1 nuclear transport factor 2 family protein [Altererythrobacter sp. CAU 1644]
MRTAVTLVAALALAGCQFDQDEGIGQEVAEELVDRYYAKFQQPGFLIDDLMKFYSPDIAFVDPTYEIVMNGESEFRETYAELGTAQSNYRNIKWDIAEVVTSGDKVVIYGNWSGTFHHCPFEVAFTTYWKLENGLIVEQRDFFAAPAFDRQVGWDPATASATCAKH